MEFVEGETLETVIDRHGRLDLKLVLEIATQVTAGLAAVHKQNLVHRDIKPTNIMVNLDEEDTVTAKIIDLGLAKAVNEASADSAISVAGGFAGTPKFASPEQFVGVGVDIRSDLYSLGVTLWEMLAGPPPFEGSPAEVMYQHQHVPLPLDQLKSVPQPFVVLLEVLLQKDPAQRFQTPNELSKAILTVRNAIDAGRPVTPQELRRSTTNQSIKPHNGRGALTTLSRVIENSRFRVLFWPVIALLVAGGLMVTANIFWRNIHPAFDASISPPLLVRSVAVLPFESLSDNKSDAYFADGVHGEILNNLAKVAQLRVISRTSVMQYRGDNKRDLRQIASALGVANVLEGTLRRAGNHVRVSTELIDARNDNTIWAESYNRDLTGIFAIQSEIAQQVASRLSAQLSMEERKLIEEKPTNNLGAYDLFLQAKELISGNYWALTSREKETYLKAINLLEQATQKDPSFTLAYCLIAKAHDVLYVDGIDHTVERCALGDAAVNAASGLRPDLPEVHLALAFHLYYCYRHFERARVEIATAAQTLSNNPDLLELMSLIDRVQGRWEKAVAALERATTLDPRNTECLAHLHDTYMYLRRYRNAEMPLNRLIELEPDNPQFLIKKAVSAHIGKADVQGARAVCEALPPSVKDDPAVVVLRVYFAICARDFAVAEEILSESPDKEILFDNRTLVPRSIERLWFEFLQGHHPTMEQFGAAREQLYQKVEADPTNPFLMAALAYADVALGRTAESIHEARRALAMRPISEDGVDGPLVTRNVAEIYAWANQPDNAFEQLNTLVKIPNLAFNYGDLKTNPCWDPIRKDPRFEKLLAELAPRD